MSIAEEQSKREILMRCAPVLFFLLTPIVAQLLARQLESRMEMLGEAHATMARKGLGPCTGVKWWALHRGHLWNCLGSDSLMQFCEQNDAFWNILDHFGSFWFKSSIIEDDSVPCVAYRSWSFSRRRGHRSDLTKEPVVSANVSNHLKFAKFGFESRAMNLWHPLAAGAASFPGWWHRWKPVTRKWSGCWKISRAWKKPWNVEGPSMVWALAQAPSASLIEAT